MEKKLAEYRTQKEREAYISKSKQKIKDILTLPTKIYNKQETPEIPSDHEEHERLIDNADVISETSDTEDDSVSCCSLIDVVYYGMWFVMWATLYAIFIKLQFGTVYLLVSALVFIYFNTRTKPKNRYEISAYSVFNKNCESIDGTLKAEQFEREIRFGRGVFHV